MDNIEEILLTELRKLNSMISEYGFEPLRDEIIKQSQKVDKLIVRYIKNKNQAENQKGERK